MKEWINYISVNFGIYNWQNFQSEKDPCLSPDRETERTEKTAWAGPTDRNRGTGEKGRGGDQDTRRTKKVVIIMFTSYVGHVTKRIYSFTILNVHYLMHIV